MSFCIHCVHCVFHQFTEIVDESGGPDFIAYVCELGDELFDDDFRDYENDCPNYVLNEAMIKACKGSFRYQVTPGKASEATE